MWVGDTGWHSGLLLNAPPGQGHHSKERTEASTDSKCKTLSRDSVCAKGQLPKMQTFKIASLTSCPWLFGLCTLCQEWPWNS